MKYIFNQFVRNSFVNMDRLISKKHYLEFILLMKPIYPMISIIYVTYTADKCLSCKTRNAVYVI